MGRSGNRADLTEPVRYPGRLGRYGEDDEQALLEARQSRDDLEQLISEFEEDIITEVDLPIGEQVTRPLPALMKKRVPPVKLAVVPYKPPPVPSPLPLTRTEVPKYTGSALARRPQAQQTPPPFRGYVPSTRPPPLLEPPESPGHEWVGATLIVASLTGLVLLAMVAGVVAAGWMS
jgi:hypothetical protein